MNTARERSDWKKKGKRRNRSEAVGGRRGRQGGKGECLGVGLGGGGVGVGGGRSAPFPPKKRRVKRWTLYK